MRRWPKRNRTLRKYQERERRALRTGDWGAWRQVTDLRPPRTTGWLSEVHPDLAVAETHEGGGVVALRLVSREEARHAA